MPELDYGLDFLLYLKLGDLCSKFAVVSQNPNFPHHPDDIYLMGMFNVYRRQLYLDLKEKWANINLEETYQL